MYEMSVAADRAEQPRSRRNDPPTRRCILSGDALPRDRMIRFVVGPNDLVVPDISERLPGRGLWLTGRRDIVAQACANDTFRRAARRAATPLIGPNGEDLAALVDAQLAQRCLEALGLARRAGRVVVGFDQVRVALKGMVTADGRARGSAILLTAQGSAADGRNKLKALADRVADNGARLNHRALFDAQTLGKAVGRDQVVHLMVHNDAAGQQLDVALARLAGYRGATAPAEVVDTD